VIEHISARRGYLLNISSLSAITHAPLLGAYSTAKAGVEALSDALRLETLPSGARVGCAYFGFIDTDLVRGGFAGPSSQAARSQMPGFIGKPAPLSKAIDAIEDGIERRAARVWAPRWLGPMLVLRGLVQPLIERGVERDTAPLAESLRLADPRSGSGEVTEQDPVLGVAARAIK
jgi:NAD(P)-dependent dehydrogenase (short-subunit alcohol dehydrogenase family)